jgi:lysyl-tRNA synthetase class 1
MTNNHQKSFENVHWADHSAQRVIDTFPNEEIYTVASGITPSGIVHVGHFREIITSELVRKALERKGKKTKFIYSWDSYDAFRKVPKNVPESFHQYLRLPVSKVPDPDGKYESFAEKFMQEAEKSLEVFNFPIIFQRQHQLQTSGVYAEGIKNHLNKLDEIRAIINKFRDEDRQLGKEWFPLTVYAEDTGKDTTKVLEYDGEYTLTYENTETGFKNTINFKETPIVKLSWRLDWPMRWKEFGVTFEPGGKDHSTPGGSYDTGCDIVRVVSNREPPVYTFYNFVSMKGQNGKVSSSSGNGATIGDVLEVYTPEMILYIFASTRPNAEFDISFDGDVIKLYEDFDKLERLYYGLETENNEKKLATLKRVYELSMVNGVEIQKELPFQPSFRHLSVIAQANDFDFEKVKEYFKSEIKTEFDANRLEQRFNCVKNWIRNHAPNEFVFSINENLEVFSSEEHSIILDVKENLEKISDPKELMKTFKEVSEKHNIEVKDFFSLMYRVIISKEKGPKLATFLIENKTKILKLFAQEPKIVEKAVDPNRERNDFEKLGLQIGEIIEVKKHPDSKKLYIFKVNLGTETRQILSGIQEFYTEEELLHKKVVVLSNLKEAKLAGEISQGMILAVENEDTCKLLHSTLPAGTYIKCGSYIADNQNTIKFKDFEKVILESKNGEVFYKNNKLEEVSVDDSISGRVC